MLLGKLEFEPIAGHEALTAPAVSSAIVQQDYQNIFVASIDACAADTATFCDQYDIGLDISANCVVLEAKRADKTWYVACMVLATDKADVNGIIRKYVDARKISFASMDTAVTLTNMEYGGITPIGLPPSWTILVDEKITNIDFIVIGSGLRSSKLAVPGKLLTNLPNAQLLKLSKA